MGTTGVSSLPIWGTVIVSLRYAIGLPGPEIRIPHGRRIMTTSLSPVSVYRRTVPIVTVTNCLSQTPSFVIR
ncbi:hypothetical protein BDZ97DRAFT_1865401 [Flammula alnicola]|nr:hypothetical protein BDZ97DRAFT_1865401 [Flammula alnicola]